jgi:hypothetical protein
MLREFDGLSTPLVADACIRTGVPLRVARAPRARDQLPRCPCASTGSLGSNDSTTRGAPKRSKAPTATSTATRTASTVATEPAQTATGRHSTIGMAEPTGDAPSRRPAAWSARNSVPPIPGDRSRTDVLPLGWQRQCRYHRYLPGEIGHVITDDPTLAQVLDAGVRRRPSAPLWVDGGAARPSLRTHATYSYDVLPQTAAHRHDRADR